MTKHEADVRKYVQDVITGRVVTGRLARLAVWRLGDFGAEAITPESMSLVALHECLHILLFDLINVASGKSTDEEVESAEHRVINVLEKILKDCP